MTTPELVSHYLCPYVQRAVITLLEKNIPHRRTYIDLAEKPNWFKAISPLGKVPLLRVDGEVLFESAVICEYLEETAPDALHPTDPLLKAKHRAAIEFGSTILNDIGGFYSASDATAFARQQENLRRKFAWLEKSLGSGPYFSGQKFHLVDAAYGPIFRYFDAFDRIGDFGILDGFGKVAAYRRALAARPSVKDAVISDYNERLWRFLHARKSYLSHLMPLPAADDLAN